jgi:hypothetical protein
LPVGAGALDGVDDVDDDAVELDAVAAGLPSR